MPDEIVLRRDARRGPVQHTGGTPGAGMLRATIAGLALTVLGSCATAPPPTAGPDCRPFVASVNLICWFSAEEAPLSQCEVARENPPGCDIGPAAIAYFNSGLDLSPAWMPDGPGSAGDRPRWIQFEVFRDPSGRVGRLYTDRQGVKTVHRERVFTADPG